MCVCVWCRLAGLPDRVVRRASVVSAQAEVFRGRLSEMAAEMERQRARREGGECGDGDAEMEAEGEGTGAVGSGGEGVPVAEGVTVQQVVGACAALGRGEGSGMAGVLELWGAARRGLGIAGA